MRYADVLGLRAVNGVAEDPAPATAALPVHAFPAVAAAAARRDARDQDTVTGADRADVAAHVDDLPDGFVSEHRAGAYLRYVALENVQIGPADRDGVDTDDRVGGILDTGIRHVLPRGLSGTVEHECFHDDAFLDLADACGGGDGV